MRTHSDIDWSEQQKKLIDSQIKSVRKFYKKNLEIAKRVLERLRTNNLNNLFSLIFKIFTNTKDSESINVYHLNI